MDTPDDLAGSLKSVLLSNCTSKGPLSTRELTREFQDLMGTVPDFAKFHFNSLDDFLLSMPDSFQHVSGGRWQAIATDQAQMEQIKVMSASKAKSRGSRGGKFSSGRGRPMGQFGAAYQNFSGHRGGRGASHSQSSYSMGTRSSYSRNDFGSRQNDDRYNGGDRYNNRNNNYGGQDNDFYEENSYDQNGRGYYDDDSVNYGRNDEHRGEENTYGGNNGYRGNDSFGANDEYGRERNNGGQRHSVFGRQTNADNGGGSVFDDPSFRRSYPSNNINSFAARDSQESKSSGANGYASANESSFHHGSEGSYGGSQQYSHEPPPPVLGQTVRGGFLSTLANKFGSPAAPKETARIPLQENNPPPPSSTAKSNSNNRFNSPPPGLIGPPPGLENIRTTFDMTSMKDALTSPAASDSATTVTDAPAVATIQIRDLVEPAMEILREKWPNPVEGGYLIDLLADLPEFEKYMTSFVDQRDALTKMITKRANKAKKAVYVEYKKDPSGNEKCFLSFIPGHPQRESFEKTQEEIIRMTCPLLKAVGDLSIHDIVQRLGIEGCFQYAPASLLFATYRDHTDLFELRGQLTQKIVSLVEGAPISPWRPSSASAPSLRAPSAPTTPAPRPPVITNEEPDPPMLGSTRSEIGGTATLLAQAREKVSKNPVVPSIPTTRLSAIEVPIVPPSNVTLSTLLRTKNENLLGDDAWMQVHVCHFKDLSTFAIRTVESQIEFKNLSRKLCDVYSVRATNKGNYERGELVCILVGDDYFRAVIQESSRKEYRVYRIDVGDYAFVEKSNIFRLLNEDFIKPAALATKCSVGIFDVRVEEETMDTEEQGFGEVLMTKDKFLRIRIKQFKSDEITVDISLDVNGHNVEIPCYFVTANYIVMR